MFFSIKAHYSHLPQFGGFKGFLSHVENPYFILLTREDLLKQAISLSIARQTGVWISGQEAKSSDVKYDEKDIAFCLKRTILHNASWKYLLSTHNVKYMELTFEKARDNLPQAVDRIAEFMGLDVPVEQFNIEPATKKQSTAINNEWRERFLESKHQEILLDINLALGQKSKKTQLKELLFNKKKTTPSVVFLNILWSYLFLLALKPSPVSASTNIASEDGADTSTSELGVETNKFLKLESVFLP